MKTKIVLLILYLLTVAIIVKSDTVDQQIVLQVTSSGTAGKVVVPKAVVVSLLLVPVSGESVKAPDRGDYLICRTHDFQDENHIQHAGFKCGTDVYVIAGIRYDHKK